MLVQIVSEDKLLAPCIYYTGQEKVTRNALSKSTLAYLCVLVVHLEVIHGAQKAVKHLGLFGVQLFESHRATLRLQQLVSLL